MASAVIATVSDPPDPPDPLHSTPLLSQENAPPIAKKDPVLRENMANGTTKQPSTSVLLVEDNAINLKLLIACVKKMKHDYLTATNGAEAVDVYASFTGKIPLIFMDIQMPVMDGIEATRKIRQQERDSSLPRSRIVVLTALGSDEAKQLALDCGADLFLTKPVSLKTLTGLLVQYCEAPT